MATSETRRFLAIYLNDHLAGAAAGVDLARRTAHARRNSAGADRLERLAADIAADRGALLTIMRSLDMPVRRYKSVATWAAEKVARLKLNGRLRSRSPLSDLVELEALRLAVEGKAAGWRTLLSLVDREPALDAERLRTLLDRAEAQITILEELRVRAVEEAFGDRTVRAATAATP
ncbi:hypothetical protein E1200_28260 [Actinomadura sp. GC306]|uniref:hypothetical protein n=1 Tax=Actinomadura sp. GC306 TaxID=2530367 RepID=UPI00104D95C2|nr:hypothetical protein [Actinomadura sp. GC306]TDC61744.1 hypothetical protein E1200_28260 [Actinomadura sp. GC306]